MVADCRVSGLSSQAAARRRVYDAIMMMTSLHDESRLNQPSHCGVTGVQLLS